MKRLIVHAFVAVLACAFAASTSALAQDDSAAAKRKKQYGLDASASPDGRGQSPGQGLRRSEGAPDQKKEKRGNTPPGSDRAGDGPASGAIVDPAGVTKK